ncbi:PAS domain S-box protein (plasmid) [Deinococcus taeanensis]|uniref:PAS domain-containing protein n=1 Tax=Deinococcus taeanensis TaxID=2737050 RepID=UPI001CDBFD5F|nr:PAS domain S-box protein [Deinococcus taeanensis]UBV45382.1 PAS domain S-box protein [Deinococcus taeanensis]
MNSTARLADLLQLINGVIWEADLQSRSTTYASAQMQAILGYAPETWEGATQFWENLVHPDDLARVVDQTERKLKLARPYEVEYRFRAADGRVVWIRDHITPLFEQGRVVRLGGIMMDITEQKNTEGHLQAALDRFAKVFSTSPVGIVLTGLRGGRVLECNDAFLQIIGLSHGEFVGSTNDTVNPWADLADRDEMVRRMERGGAVRDFETRLLHFPSRTFRDVTLFTEQLELEGEEVILVIAQDVTDRKAAHAARDASESRFRALVQHSTDMVTVVNRAGRLSYVSPSLETILGYNADAVLGMDVLSFMRADLHLEVRAVFREAITGGPGATRAYTSPIRHKNGEHRWLEWVATNRLADPHVRGVVINARDVTERVASEQALTESRNTFEALFEHSPDAILLVDVEGDMPIVACNEVAARMNGYTREELVGRSTYLTLPDEEAAALLADPQANDDFRRRLMASGRLHFEATHQRKDGTRYPVEIHLALVNISGRDLMLSIERDISERRAAELALQASQARLLSTEKLASLGRLTAGLAHEINTPLAAVMNALHEAKALAGEYRDSVTVPTVTPDDHLEIARDLLQAVADADRAAARIGEFIRNMRGHTRDQVSGAQDFDAYKLAGDTLAMIAHQARTAKVDLLLERAKGPVVVHGEPGRFTQIVTNLVVNAVHACEDSGRTRCSVTLRFDVQNDWIVLHIEDTGTGIPAHVLPRIFDPLFTTKDVGKGTGLGLSIIYDIITGHFGGEVDVNTEVGVGTTFIVRFPRAVPS